MIVAVTSVGLRGLLNRYAGRVDKLGESGIDAALQAGLDRHPDIDRRHIPDARRARDDGLVTANQDLAHRGG